MNTALLKLAALVLGSEDGRKGVGWVLVAIFAPFILLIAVISSLASGEAQHNVSTVEACFYGTELSEKAPDELRDHIAEMRRAFSLLDSAVTAANEQAEDGNSLDPIRVKAVFLALCFGEDAPSARAAGHFVDCFFTTEDAVREVEQEDEDGNPITDENGDPVTEEESYTRTVPLPVGTAYENVAALLGRELTDDDRANIDHIYTMIAGDQGDVTYDGSYSVSGSYATEIDISIFSDPATKTGADLAAWAINAWESGWGYVWGTYGQVLSQGNFASKLEQYPDGVGKYADFIQANWLGRRTADCVGLIKGYGWYDPENDKFVYNANGMPDTGANQMYYAATESGPIDTIPEIPGLAVWHDGHIGVYIGHGEVVEAMGTMYGVVKTQLAGRGWTHWLKVPYTSYD